MACGCRQWVARDGTAARHAAQALLKAKRKAVGHRITGRAVKAYDMKDHGATLRAIDVSLHVPRNKRPTKTGRSAIDGRTTRHPSYGEEAVP
jgi:hypothetical protein